MLELQNGPVFAETPTTPVNPRTQHAGALGNHSKANGDNEEMDT